MLGIIAIAVAFLAGLVVGAYSHDWLQRITGAPSNLTVASAPAAVSAVVAHGESAAVTAINAVATQAILKIKA